MNVLTALTTVIVVLAATLYWLRRVPRGSAPGASASAPPPAPPAPPALPSAPAGSPRAAPAAAGASPAGGSSQPSAAAAAGPCVRFFWGSQTGTASKMARELAAAAGKRYGVRAEAVDLGVFEGTGGTAGEAAAAAARASLLAPCVCVFLVATYGEGDPTDNAAAFFAWLARDAPPLPALRFSVFSLGNRQYENFCHAGRVLDARLEALGAARLYARGEGDDDGTLEEDFEKWREGGLWRALRGAADAAALEAPAKGGAAAQPGRGAEGGGGGGGDPDAALEWRLVPLPPPAAPPSRPGIAASDAALREAGAACDVSSRPLFMAAPLRVAASRELRQAPAPGAATQHVELDLAGTGLRYGTADTLHVCPENDAALVAAVAARLALDPGAWFALQPRGSPAPPPLFPTPCTVRAALTHFLDIAGPPKRDLLRALARFAAAPGEAAELAASGAAWHKGARGGGGGGLLEVLLAFPSLAPPLEALVQLLPRLSPRAYTIASSPLLQPARLAICASVLETPRASGGGGGEVKGVCSNFLARLRPGEFLRAVVRPSTFKLPADRALPLILVGPGTGVAPMRAFLQERRAARDAGAALGPAVLFFGCRGQREDFIYREELEGALRDGLLHALHTAFSRERAEKVYVQHLVAREGAALWALLQGGALVFVCGGKAMGADVKRAFETVAEVQGGQPSGAAFVKDLGASGRYVQELWS